MVSFLLLLAACRSSDAAPCEDGVTQACDLTGGCAGTQQCTEGAWSTCTAPAERCDGIDNDCDGQVDEDFPGLGEACRSGQGACEAIGTQVCGPDGASVVCSAVAGTPQQEVCNGLDDDCNGQVDDVEGEGGTCVAGTGRCEQAGTLTCDVSAEVLACHATPGTPVAESCNGVDDDCNGTTDDVEGLGSSCVVGVGACERTGALTCDGSSQQLACDVVAGAPSAEACNGIDDDCDGVVDNVRLNFAAPIQASADRPCADLSLGDLNGDGWLDIVCAPGAGTAPDPDTRLFTYLNRGDGDFHDVSYLQPVAGAPTQGPSQVAVGDLDGDGDLDLVAVGPAMEAQVYLNAGNGTFASPYSAFPLPSSVPAGTSALVLGDLDGDGDLDIATSFRAPEASKWQLAISLNNGAAGFSSALPHFVAIERPNKLLLADVERDGDLDLVATTGSHVLLFRLDLPLIHAPTALLNVGGLREGPVLTDLDADGFPDLVVPAMHTLYLLPGTSSGFGPARHGDASWDERGIAAGQFDCDQPPELLVISDEPGASLTYLSAPPDLTSVPLVPDVEGSVLQVGDLDNDGDLDVVFGGVTPGVQLLSRD